MNAKTNTAPMAKVSFTSYGSPSIFVPTAKLGALMDLLAQCRLVTSEWTGGAGSADVLSNNKVEVILSPDAPLTQEEFNALREAVKAEEAAKEAAKPTSDE